jgi:hypothetical protein
MCRRDRSAERHEIRFRKIGKTEREAQLELRIGFR